MYFNSLRVGGVKTGCNLINRLRKPMRLPFEHRYTSKHEMVLIGVVLIARVIEINNMHERKGG